MSNIRINNLDALALFTDSESYLTELTEGEANITGGIYTSYRWIWNPPIRIPKFWA